MILYLGGKQFVRDRDIIGIFDFDSVTISNNTKSFLKNAESENKLKYVSIYDFPLSFILTNENIYVSPIAAKTLKRRLIKKLI